MKLLAWVSCELQFFRHPDFSEHLKFPTRSNDDKGSGASKTFCFALVEEQTSGEGWLEIDEP